MNKQSVVSYILCLAQETHQPVLLSRTRHGPLVTVDLGERIVEWHFDQAGELLTSEVIEKKGSLNVHLGNAPAV